MATLFSDELIKVAGVLIVVLAVIYLMFDFLKSFITKMTFRKKENGKKNDCPAMREDCNDNFKTIGKDINQIKVTQGIDGEKIENLVKGQDEIKDDVKCIKNKILGI